ncbi:carbohydrate sulfotransferase 9-like [Heptranchias perlo]|uniref:carbohydrate sulfotransferase 9-like n=1 Tax=Heptranchias perlo TaxID=212740 RepID=UPI00355A6F40
MDFPGWLSVTLLLLGYLGWLFCNEWKSDVVSPAREDSRSVAVSVPETFDSFVHNQQLRKKLLRSFCSQRAKVNMLLRPSFFSRLRVNERHELVYCSPPDVGAAGWEGVLKALNDVPGQAVKIVNDSAPLKAPHENLSQYDMSTIGSLLRSYTKIIFVRDPLQRLLSTYSREWPAGRPFEEFLRGMLEQGSKSAASWKPIVDLCHPCLVRYDYVAAYGLLNQELRYILRRLGFSEEVELPRFQDSEESRWLVEQHFGQLSAKLKGELFRFYHGDFAAFNFTNGLTLN